MPMTREQIHALNKQVKGLALSLSGRKLLALDCGDRYLARDILERVKHDLQYLNALQQAKCSVLLETCDWKK